MSGLGTLQDLLNDHHGASRPTSVQAAPGSIHDHPMWPGCQAFPAGIEAMANLERTLASAMTEQLVITERTSQAKDVRAAVGSRYGAVLAAEGHLFDLQEPEDVLPAWKRWTAVLLRPDALYGTRPAAGGNKAAKLNAIRDALRGARRVWLASDCDREGQLIGQGLTQHRCCEQQSKRGHAGAIPDRPDHKARIQPAGRRCSRETHPGRSSAQAAAGRFDPVHR